MLSRIGILVLGSMLASTVLGCGGSPKRAETADGVEEARARPLDVLPEGAIAYGRIDLEALRASPYAERVIGWYEEFAPAIPDFNEEPGVKLAEEVLARTESVGVALFPPAREYPDALGEDEGFVAVMRGGVDLAFVQKWADRFHIELARGTHAGRTVLTTADPSREQMMVVELEDGLLGFVFGELPDVHARIEAMVARMEGGASGLAAEPLVETASLVSLSDAPAGFVVLLVPGLAEEIGEEMSEEGIAEASIVTNAEAVGLRFDPSETLVMEVAVPMKGPGHAQRAAERMRELTEEYASNAFTLLLGFDLWLEHTTTKVEGESVVRSSTRIPAEDMHAWLFHVEHLAAAAKAFFVDGEGLGGLLSGMGARPPVPPTMGPGRRMPSREQAGEGAAEKTEEVEESREVEGVEEEPAADAEEPAEPSSEPAKE